MRISPARYKITPMISSIKTIGIITGTTVSFAAALAVFGVDSLPRPAWASEVMELAGELIELDSRVTAQQLDDTKLQYYQNLREQDKHDAGFEPEYLIDEQILLERRIDDLGARLDQLRTTGS